MGIPVSTRIEIFLGIKLVLQRFFRSFLLMAKILPRFFGVGYGDLRMILFSGLLIAHNINTSQIFIHVV